MMRSPTGQAATPPPLDTIRRDQRLGERVSFRGAAFECGDGEVSLSFDRNDGTVMRLRLVAQEARALASLLQSRGKTIGSHSDRSSGNPISSVSTPEDGENV